MPAYSLPKILDYNQDIPIDVHSQIRYGVATPINSTSFAGGDEIIFSLPRAGSDALLLPNYCKFRATITVSTSAAVISGTIDSIFSSLEVRYQGQQLEYINQYETLHAAYFDSMVTPDDRSTGYTLSKISSSARGSLLGETIDADGTRTFITNLMSGIVGTLARRAFPINILAGNLELRLLLNSAAKAYAANASSSYALTNVEFQMAYIKLPNELVSTVTRQPLDYHTKTFTNIQKVVASGTTVIEESLVFRYSSLNTILVTMRPQSVTTTSTEHITSRANYNINTYVFKLGSEQVPTNLVKGYGYGFVEPFEKLKEALHLAGSIEMPGCHTYTSWNYQTNTSGAGSFLIMQDFEKIQGSSGEVISGADTRNQDVIFSATFPAVNSIAAAALFDYFAEYNVDIHIENGQISKFV
jgi:hypothetical protein